MLQIIQVNLTSENPRPISPDTTLQFTYSVKWEATDIPFSKRFDRYLDYNFFEHQVRIDPIRAWALLSRVHHTTPSVTPSVVPRAVLMTSASGGLQIHWFSIFNSFMMVIFLTGLVSMILMRTLRNDYAKYAREEDDLETLVRVGVKPLRATSGVGSCSRICPYVFHSLVCRSTPIKLLECFR